MLDLATQLAVKISEAKTVRELETVGMQIKAQTPELDGWLEWLRDTYMSKKKDLEYVFTDEHLTKEGKNALNNRP